MRQVRSPGRWIWTVSGLVTAVIIVLPAGKGVAKLLASGTRPWASTASRTVSVPQRVTRLNIDNDGPIGVTAGPVQHVQITESIGYDGRPPPTVPLSVSGGELTVDGTQCQGPDTCAISLQLTVPAGVTAYLDSQGGPVDVSGLAAATIHSGGGPVWAGSVGGPLNADTEGGPLTVANLSGPLTANTGGGPVIVGKLTSATADVTTEGGDVQLRFAAAPGSVSVSTGGGAATLWLPGGPYALTVDTGGGEPEQVGIATDPASRRSVTVTSEGGPVWIEPPSPGPGPRGAPAPPAPAPPAPAPPAP